jgi:hypothetical protein
MVRDRDKRKKLKKQRARAAAKMTGARPDFIGDKTPTTQTAELCRKCGMVEELGSHNPDDHDPHNFEPMR